MLNKFVFSLLLIISITLISCSPKHSEIIVAEYGDSVIKMQEFEKAYTKNVGSVEIAKADSIKNYEKFLDLYVKFKMKLKDARLRRLHKDQAIINELNDYQKTIGASYLIEKQLYEKGIEELYKKRSEEVRVSHILIRTDSLSDAEAEQKALDIIERIKNGSSFEEEAEKYSDDQFSKTKGGDIYYITAGMIMPSFEDAAYETSVGQVNPTPLKTRYGYHIIKVTDRIPRTPKIKASHILVAKQNGENSDSKDKLKLAEDILTRIKNGEDFGKLAAEYSDDPGSKTKNGDLGYFSRRQMVQPFDLAAFKLKTGEVSDIVETQFGYHIIKVTDRVPYPSLDSERKELRQIYDKTKKQQDYDELILEYANEVNLVMHDEVFKEVASNPFLTFDKGYWGSEVQENVGNKVLFTIADKQFSTDSLMSFILKDSKNLGQKSSEVKLKEHLTNYKNSMVLEAKASVLVKQDPQFATLMDEYKNGILIFRLQEDEVWNKMKMDSTEIVNLYNNNMDRYVWPNRVQFATLFTTKDTLAQEYLEMLEQGADFDSLVNKYSEKLRAKNPAKDQLIAADTNPLSKAAYNLQNVGDISGLVRDIDGWNIVKLIKKEAARTKTFEEARTEVTSTYQDVESKQLEDSYVNRLKKVYSPELFYEELEHAYKN